MNVHNNDKHRQALICNFFPKLSNNVLSSCLKVDDKSLFYISDCKHIQNIKQLINQYVLTYSNIKLSDVNIVDGVCGIGHSTINFALNYNKIYSVESNILKYNYLENNVSLYDLKNIHMYNNECIKIIQLLTDYHVVYLDFTGTINEEISIIQNKNNDDVTLKINNIKIEKLCKKIIESKINKDLIFIMLKLPMNYDVEYMYGKLSDCNCTMKLHNIVKSYILIIIPNKTI